MFLMDGQHEAQLPDNNNLRKETTIKSQQKENH